MSPVDERGFEKGVISGRDQVTLIDTMSDKVHCPGYDVIAPAVKENIRCVAGLQASIDQTNVELRRMTQRMDGIPRETADIARNEGNEAHRMLFEGLTEDFRSLRKDVFEAIEKQANQWQSRLSAVYEKMETGRKEGCEQVHMAAEKIKVLEGKSTSISAVDNKTVMWQTIGKAGPVAVTVIGCVAVVTSGVVFAYLKTRGAI